MEGRTNSRPLSKYYDSSPVVVACRRYNIVIWCLMCVCVCVVWQRLMWWWCVCVWSDSAWCDFDVCVCGLTAPDGDWWSVVAVSITSLSSRHLWQIRVLNAAPLTVLSRLLWVDFCLCSVLFLHRVTNTMCVDNSNDFLLCWCNGQLLGLVRTWTQLQNRSSEHLECSLNFPGQAAKKQDCLGCTSPWWQFVLMHWWSCIMPGPVSTWMSNWALDNYLKVSKPSHCRTSHPSQLSLVIPLWVGAMSTSESFGVNRHTKWCTSPCPSSCNVSWCLTED